MWSQEFDTGSRWGENSISQYKQDEFPLEIDFTFEEICNLFHESGSAGTAHSINIQKDLGNGRTKEYYGIHLHVSDWLNMAKREIDRARQGLEPTRYLAQRARSIYWVNPKLCNPVIDSSKYPATQNANQKRMVA